MVSCGYRVPRVRRLAVALVAASLIALAGAAATPAADPPPVQGTSALVANGTTGEIIWSKRARRKVPIASITKVMTALVTLNRSRSSEIVTVDPAAAAVGGATVDLRADERISIRDLLEATLIESANDAANALAIHIGGSGGAERFVRLMNRKARRLSLTDTTFIRPDGLDVRGHRSSARDVFRLALDAMENAEFRGLVRLQKATIAGDREVETTNDLLGSYPGLLGVKTGHTTGAGWSQVAAARRDGVVIYAVILGSPSRERRNADLRRLLDWGLSEYGRVTLVEAGRQYAETRVPFEDERTLALIADRSVNRVVRYGEPLIERVVAPSVVRLPVTAGEARGSIQILKDGEVIAERDLVAAESIPAPNFPLRFGWYAQQTLSNLGDVFDFALGWLR